MILPAMFAPNPNDRRACFWLEFEGSFRPVCPDPSAIDSDAMAYVTHCGSAICERDARQGGGAFCRSPEFAFVDYTDPHTVTLPAEHPHLKRIFSHKYRPKERSLGEKIFATYMQQRNKAGKEAFLEKLNAEYMAMFQEVQEQYNSRTVSTQDALFELLIDIVGVGDYPGGRDLYREPSAAFPQEGSENIRGALPSREARAQMLTPVNLTIEKVLDMITLYFLVQYQAPPNTTSGIYSMENASYVAALMGIPLFTSDDIASAISVAEQECRDIAAVNEAEQVKWAGKKRKPFAFDPCPVWVYGAQMGSIVGYHSLNCDSMALPPNLKVIPQTAGLPRAPRGAPAGRRLNNATQAADPVRPGSALAALLGK